MVSHVARLLPAILLFAACGGSDSPEGSAVVYDEAVDGPLPYYLGNLSQTELTSYTVTLGRRANVVKGTSDTGEEIRLEIPPGLRLNHIDLDFLNNTERNALVVNVERFPYDGTSFIDIHDMPALGSYRYSLRVPSTLYGDGFYALRVTTAVSGASMPNVFSIAIQVTD